MKNVTEQDLTLLYYGEHKDPDIAALVAKSDELTARFRALSEELELVDAYQPPERGEEYGAEVWQRIESHLVAKESTKSRALQTWWSGLMQPRFSPAGMLGVVLVALLAFTLGRNESIPTPQGITNIPTTDFAGIDSGRLLQSSVAGHLGKLNVVLTEFANADEPVINEAEWAMDMLVTNRLYRQSAASGGDKRLANFLAGIEPLLIELAYEAHLGSNTARTRMQQEVRDDLLFKIRVMNNRLKVPEVKASELKTSDLST